MSQVFPQRGSDGRWSRPARSPERFIGFWSIDQEKKFTPRVHIYAQSFALIRVLSPPNLSYISFSHTFLSILTCFSVSVASINFFESTSPSPVLYDTGGL
jgi:hypothetical protein